MSVLEREEKVVAWYWLYKVLEVLEKYLMIVLNGGGEEKKRV
jgi:hypothetical protein